MIHYETTIAAQIFIIVIKFLYNARFHWFKQRALWEYRARNKRKLTPSSAEMADKFPNLLNSLFSNCHVGNVQVFMGNNSAGCHWT